MKNFAPTHRPKRSGFTLIEILVSITILSVMLIFLGQAIGVVSNMWLSGIGTVDNFTKARDIMTSMDRDIQSMVLRPDTAAFVDSQGNAACAFYTNVEGYISGGGGSDTRTVSLVQYALNPFVQTTPASLTTLGRLNYGMNFANGGIVPIVSTNPAPTKLAQLPTPSSSNTDTVATGVIAFQWQFVDGAGNFVTPTNSSPFPYNFSSPGYFTNPRAILISLVVLDNNAYQLANQNVSTVNAIQTDFPTTLPPTNLNQSFSQYWNSVLNPTTGTFGSGLPLPIRKGLKVFQRYIPLPVAAP